MTVHAEFFLNEGGLFLSLPCDGGDGTILDTYAAAYALFVIYPVHRYLPP
jgi:hypothetical protein